MDSANKDACPSQEDSKDEEKEVEDSEIRTKIGEYLSSQYGLLVKVLKCLTAKDLKNAAKVCRSWESAAKVILSAHKKPKWLFYRRERGWNISPQLATWTAICEHMYFEPQICLSFVSKNGFRDKEKCNDSNVPCPVSGGPPCNKSHCKKTTAMSTVFFPRMKGVTIVPFNLKPKQQAALSKGRGEDVDVTELLGLSKNEVVQALLIFSGYSVAAQCFSVLLSKLQERQKHKIAVGGAITDRSGNFEGIVFCGPNVCAASTILPQACIEKKRVQQEVLELKECSLPTENSVAFMFACLGRGRDWYDNEPCVESSILNKTLPNTPVIGFFGKGEIGTTCLPDLSKEMRYGSAHFWKVWPSMCGIEETLDDATDHEPPQKVPRRTEHFDVNYSYSTSIVLLSFNMAT